MCRYFRQDESKFFKHRYACKYVLTPSAPGLVVRAQFRGNSIYDPEVATGGHKPFGSSTMELQYSNWVVTASTITVIPQETSPGSFYEGWVGISANAPGLSYSSTTPYSTMIEAGACEWMFVHSGGEPVRQLSLKRRGTTSSVLGYLDTDETTLIGSASTNPATEWYWSLYYANTDSSSTNKAREFTVIIDYDVLWFNPRPMSAS